MLELITGVVNGLPLANEVPPEALAYHLTLLPVAARFTVPTPHRDPGVVPVTVGLLTVTVTVFENPGAPALQITLNLNWVVVVMVPVLPLAALV